MTQLIITYILVAGAFAKAIWTIYHVMTSKESEGGCGSSCPSCDAKNELKRAINRKKNTHRSTFDIKQIAQ